MFKVEELLALAHRFESMGQSEPPKEHVITAPEEYWKQLREVDKQLEEARKPKKPDPWKDQGPIKSRESPEEHIGPPPAAPAQQYFPFVPPKDVKYFEYYKRAVPCQYEDCTNKVDPQDPNSYQNPPGTFFCNDHVSSCSACGNKFLTDDMKEAGNHSYCQECFDTDYAECKSCGEVVEKGEIITSGPRARRRGRQESGCTNCSFNCTSCGRVVDKDYSYSHDGDDYCEDCFSQNFSTCEECNETVSNDDTRYVDNVGSFCESCYDSKFVRCHECEEDVEKDEAHEMDDEYYCDSCYTKIGPGAFEQYTKNLKGFSYTKKDKYLNLLNKILPISIKNLKSKHPSIANGLGDLIALSKGKEITSELVQEYRQSLGAEEFPIGYTVWTGVQRSVSESKNYDPKYEDKIKNPIDKSQLVINVIASKEMLNRLRVRPSLYDLFDKVNDLSKSSGHPYVEDQIGWVRVELANNPEPLTSYILVDEIQSDHSNATYRLKHDKGHDAQQIRSALKHKYKLDDESLDKLLLEYSLIVKDFPNIAVQAVNRFAKQNGFKKIFWHTYESGKMLKDNEPPKSLYDKVPKENFFLPSQERPFGLKGEFFEKEAKKILLYYKIANRLLGTTGGI